MCKSTEMAKVYEVINETSLHERTELIESRNRDREPEKEYEPNQHVFVKNPLANRQKLASRYTQNTVLADLPIHIYTKKKRGPVAKSRLKWTPKTGQLLQDTITTDALGPSNRAEDILLDPLGNGPGLLPFKLGSTKIISQYHSFLFYINLEDIQSKVDSIKLQLNDYSPLINNKTSSLFEPHINYLSSKLEQISLQLYSFEPSRNKRGLVDGLGSIIKSISGNLDHTDAIKYNDAIRILQGNEDKL